MKSIFAAAILIFTLFISVIAFGRAGGAGGGGGHGGGGGSFGGGFSHSTYYGNNYGTGVNGGESGLSFFFILIIFVVIVFIVLKRTQMQNIKGGGGVPSALRLPGDGEDLDPDFTNKVIIAFTTIQKSWSEKRLNLMRRFITDGVYQRFNAQFTMMNMLGQTDVISNVKVSSVELANKKSDGNYDVMTVCITAYAEDQFVSQKFPQLNSPGGGENFSEYWSFIRRKDFKKGFDIFHADVCPKCSAPLQAKLVETAQCPYCGTYINNGEYDWVLAEITQEADYTGRDAVTVAPEIQKQIPDFSQQLIEDRASNAFTQILIACADKEEAALARFSSPRALDDFKKMMSETNFLYDRLFLNSVEIADCSLQNNVCRVDVDINLSYRRVQIQNNSAHLLDRDVTTDQKRITLIREISATPSKGSIYANSCSHCGAAQKDSLSSVCAYCGQPLNDPKTEWVVDRLM